MSSATTSVGVRKPLAVGEFLAVVDDVDAKADLVREMRQMEADVARANDVQLRRRFDRLDIDAPSGRRKSGRSPARSHRRARSGRAAGWRLRIASRAFPERVVLVAPAADGADHPAVAKDQHLGADTLRRRPGGGDDRHERRRFAAFERVSDRREDFLVHSQRL